MRLLALGFCLIAFAGTQLVLAKSLKGVDNPARAKTDYMLNCQGCHGPTGAGTADGTVPRMQGLVARFLCVSGGREFLVRVPGSANAALDDKRLAEVLNWILQDMSATEMPRDFVPYATAEVKQLRTQPLTNVAEVRTKLMQQLMQNRACEA